MVTAASLIAGLTLASPGAFAGQGGFRPSVLSIADMGAGDVLKFVQSHGFPKASATQISKPIDLDWQSWNYISSGFIATLNLQGGFWLEEGKLTMFGLAKGFTKPKSEISVYCGDVPQHQALVIVFCVTSVKPQHTRVFTGDFDGQVPLVAGSNTVPVMIKAGVKPVQGESKTIQAGKGDDVPVVRTNMNKPLANAVMRVEDSVIWFDHVAVYRVTGL